MHTGLVVKQMQPDFHDALPMPLCIVRGATAYPVARCSVLRTADAGRSDAKATQVCARHPAQPARRSMAFLRCALGAGKWPDELEPYEKMKAAMGCQLAQQLHTALGLDAFASEVGGWGGS